MAEEKTYVFDSGANSGMLGMLAPLLQQRGVDPSVLYALGRDNGFGGEGA